MSTAYHSTFLVIDEHGIDPVRDKSYNAILETVAHSTHTVTPSERHNAPLISYNEYRDERYWWCILVYNGIDDMFSIQPGMVLKIPNISEMSTRLGRILQPRTTAKIVRF